MIILNQAKCLRCGDIVTSTHRHDFVWCSCESIAVDGGKDYLRRVGNPEDIKEMSVTDDETSLD